QPRQMRETLVEPNRTYFMTWLPSNISYATYQSGYLMDSLRNAERWEGGFARETGFRPSHENA
ncbi:MAG TPA: hypothetical protein V6D48_09920, partial [Oculatellaceae cyanobacterium]